MRLDKLLAQSSVGTKNNVRIHIKDGMVKLNGQVKFIIKWCK